jgi:hypothetical protein
MSRPATTTGLVAVYRGQTCAGHVMARGKAGFESFDADDNRIGMFKTMDAAVAALLSQREAAQ